MLANWVTCLQETQLVLASPHLVFRLSNKKKKEHYTLLMASDYERNNWKDTIHGLKSKGKTKGGRKTRGREEERH